MKSSGSRILFPAAVNDSEGATAYRAQVDFRKDDAMKKSHYRAVGILLAALLFFTIQPVGISAASVTPGTAKTQYQYETDPRLAGYASYIAACGIHVQPGAQIYIISMIQAYPLAELVSQYCYNLGASAVNINFYDQKAEATDIASLYHGTYENYKFANIIQNKLDTKSGDYQYLYIYSPTPDAPVPDAETVDAYVAAGKTYLKKVLDSSAMKEGNEKTWSIAIYPNAAWAHRVYPELNDSEALSAVWEDIYSFLYMTPENTDTSVITAHTLQLNQRADILSGMNIRALHFTNSRTDLTVGIHQPYRFQGPISTDGGITSLPNVICEECFTMPDKYNVNGYAAASRPLVLSGGTVVNNLRVTFKDGLLTDWSADSGTDAMKRLLEKKNAKYLGEVSIVPTNTPLFQSGRTYYTTLLDENAACHLAFGNTYPEYNLPEGAEPDDHVNESDIHVDFMIGTADTTITAILNDGTEQVIFRNGVWTF
jgi:aminopeptidase